MKRTALACFGVMLATGMGSIPSAAAEPCNGSAESGTGSIFVGMECDRPGGSTPGTDPAGPVQPSPYVRYAWSSMCAPGPETPESDMPCGATFTCPVDDEQRWRLYGLTHAGTWELMGTRCFAGTPEPYVPPTVTPADVLSALRRVGLPELETRVQPAAKTLVNLDTIFHTVAEPVDLRLTLLGQGVDVVATPSEFRWVFGDGHSSTTSSPGAAYPSTQVTHRYLDAGVTVQPHVEVSYAAQFRVSGGDWQDVGGTVTTVGPATAVQVAEATPVLSGEHR